MSRSGWEVAGVLMGIGAVAGAIAFGVSHRRGRSSNVPPLDPRTGRESAAPPGVPPLDPRTGRESAAPLPTPPASQTPLPAPHQAAPMPMTVESWRPYVAKLAPAFGADASGQPIIPIDFVLSWINVESNGIPGAVGFPGEMDMQGNAPLESGPFQFMSPHDIKEAGTTVDEMRVGTAIPHPVFPGLTRHSPPAEVDAARAKAQAMARPLTEEEKYRHVLAGLTYIANAMKLVDATGVGWAKSNPGYWALVKSHHGAFSWPGAGVAMARAGLGRNPTTWDDLLAGMRASGAYAEIARKVAASGSSNPHEVAAANAAKTMRGAFPRGVV